VSTTVDVWLSVLIVVASGSAASSESCIVSTMAGAAKVGERVVVSVTVTSIVL
jgi:hypothetical protein